MNNHFINHYYHIYKYLLELETKNKYINNF